MLQDTVRAGLLLVQRALDVAGALLGRPAVGTGRESRIALARAAHRRASGALRLFQCGEQVIDQRRDCGGCDCGIADDAFRAADHLRPDSVNFDKQGA